MKWIQQVLLKIQNRYNFVHRQRWMDGWNQYTLFQHHWSRGYKNIFGTSAMKIQSFSVKPKICAHLSRVLFCLPITTEYIPQIMSTVHTSSRLLLWFISQFYPHLSGLLHWHWGNHMITWMPVKYSRGDSRFASSQWEMALHCNAISHWLGASLESAL